MNARGQAPARARDAKLLGYPLLRQRMQSRMMIAGMDMHSGATMRHCLSVHLWHAWTCGMLLMIGLAATLIYPAASQTVQPPGDDFYLQAVQEDLHHIFGVMDANNLANVTTGFVQLNPLIDPTMPTNVRKSQWWRDELLVSGDGDSVKLKNDATGLCIGWGNGPVAPMLSCDDGLTIWRRVPTPHGIVYQHGWTNSVLGVSVFSAACLSTEPDLPGAVVTDGCGEGFDGHYPDYMVWSRTNAPIGTVSTGLGTPSPPPVPPKQPTACRVDGAAVCGQVEFSCDPLSASDTIVVSGMAGVKVTSVQANIGMVNGTYLNSGAARVSICATKPGAFACSSSIVVSFGPRTCINPSPPPTQLCPTGENICRGVCKPFGQCDIIR